MDCCTIFGLTCDHTILLTHLNEELGIYGLALEWFKSYLAKRGQRVSIDGSLSERFSLQCVSHRKFTRFAIFFVYLSTVSSRNKPQQLLQRDSTSPC